MPNNKARSLSTLIAVSVNNDTKHNTSDVKLEIELIETQSEFKFPFSIVIKTETNSGSKRIPTKKSARASERNKILEGG